MEALVPGKRSHIVAQLLQSSATANRGLIWDRYLPMWDGEPAAGRIIRHNMLRDVLEQFAKHSSSDEQLDERFKRFQRALGLLDRVPVTLKRKLSWHLASGLGNDHPTENGFTFDSVSGSPVLTGSAIKGMCRRWADCLEWDKEKITRLFGPEITKGNGNSAQGDALFFDAFPEKSVRLHADIVNCHHKDYYGGTANEPLETESPNPVFFLSVKSGAVFLFTVLAQNAADAEDLAELLNGALMNLGIGAKTAVGYGIFTQ